MPDDDLRDAFIRWRDRTAWEEAAVKALWDDWSETIAAALSGPESNGEADA